MRRLALLASCAGLLVTGLAGTAQAAPKTWHIEITNLTAAQPMSPPLWAVHDNKIDIWSPGQLASAGVLPIVEDAVNGPLQTYLTSNSHVREVKTETGDPAGPIVPGASREFDVTSKGRYRYLSTLWMLVRTNDGFTGLDAYKLDRGKRKGKGRKGARGAGSKTKTLMLNAYDAGTENNNQDCDFIPGPPCSNPGVRDATAAPIGPHPGITGGDIGTAPADGGAGDFRWTEPVAKVEITRTK